MEILKLINFGSKNLKDYKIQSHMIDSELILSNILKKSREHLIINSNKKVSKKVINLFNKLIKRRSTREPMAYIFKNKEFWSKNFYVNQNTLIPRPETELLSEYIIKTFKDKKMFILDIGTGTGCILFSILSELKKSTGVGIDISKKAIDVAKINQLRHNLSKRSQLIVRSFEKLKKYKFDLIVSNPPYIKNSEIKNLSEDIKRFEPKIALKGGNDGLDVIKKIIYKSNTILKNFGTLALEIGNDQQDKVSQILDDQEFKIKHLIKDYQNNTRCIIAKLKN
ncbi:MAG: release factor glutamine methyltransferase [Pelagibacterales bacterium]|jgi:release factor glutamine methyltransferase|nr:release factor glutamine methyltransferase [Pelagibacterales bacterium]